MKIHTIDASVWWIVLADEIRPRDGTVLKNWIPRLQQIFNFAQLPTQLPQPGQGFDFLEGSFEENGEILPITKLSVFNDGLSIMVSGDTTRAEKALTKIIDFFYSLGYREPITPPLHLYISTIVADFDRSLDKLFPSSILEKIAAAMPISGDAHVLAFRTNFDPGTLTGRIAPLNPTLFSIERRLGPAPCALNRYWCQANSTTEKHIEVLEEIERSV